MLNVEEIINKTRAKKVGLGRYQGHCPNHDDKNPSLSISEKSDNKVLVHCHAGCSQEDVLSHFKSSPDKELGNRSRIQKKPKIVPGDIVDRKSIIIKYFQQTRGISNFNIDHHRLRLRRISESIFAIEVPINYYNSKENCGSHLIYVDENSRNILDVSGQRNKKVSYGNLSKGEARLGKKSSLNRIHLCEGVEDAVAIASSINEEVIPRFGTGGLSNFIPHRKTKEVYIWADNDEPGLEAAEKTKEKLTSKKLKVKVLIPGETKDWNDSYINNPSEIIDKYNEAILEDWEVPEKLQQKPIYISPISSDECHPLLFDFAMEEAAISQSSSDYFICAIIVTFCSFISRIFEIQPLEHNPNYRENCNLWGVLIGKPGTKKSNAISVALSILEKTNKSLMKKERDNIKDHFNVVKELRELEKDLEKMLKKSSSSEDEIESIQLKIQNKQEELEAKPLKYKTLIVQDITAGALIQRLSRTNENILLCMDEFSAFMNMSKSQFKSEIRPIALQAWNGNGFYHKETKRDGVEYIETLSMSILGAIQPSKYEPAIKEIFRGYNDDGFIQRIQVAVFPDDSQKLPIPQSYNHFYKLRLERFCSDLAEYYETISKKRTIKLSESAHSYYEKIISMQDRIEFLDEQIQSTYISFVCKLPKLFCSLSLLNALLSFKNKVGELDEIDSKSAEMAYKLCLKLQIHLKKIIFKETSPEDSLSLLLIDKIKEGKIYNRIKVREIKRSSWRGLTDEDKIYCGLRRLEECNWLKVKEGVPSLGYGRPSEYLELNPLIIKNGIKNYIKD